jgi:hypothetical protein
VLAPVEDLPEIGQGVDLPPGKGRRALRWQQLFPCPTRKPPCSQVGGISEDFFDTCEVLRSLDIDTSTSMGEDKRFHPFKDAVIGKAFLDIFFHFEAFTTIIAAIRLIAGGASESGEVTVHAGGVCIYVHCDLV